MAQERTGVATLKGNPLTLIGPELKRVTKLQISNLTNRSLTSFP